MIFRAKLLLSFLVPHQAGHNRSKLPTRGSHRPESHGPEAIVSILLKTQHPKEPLQEVSDNLMLSSSSALACLDLLCNGNCRFITPAGVANHRRRETCGRGMSGGELHRCPLLTTCWVHAGLHARLLTHRYAGRHASSRACKQAPSDMAHTPHDACVPPSTQRPSWEDVRKTSHISSSLSCRFGLTCARGWKPAHTHTHNGEGLKQRNRFAGGLKQQ